MFYYCKEPLSIRGLFVNSWDLFLHTYRFSWIWAFFNALLFLISDYFTLPRITNFIHWQYFAFQINLIILVFLFYIPWGFLRSIITIHMHLYAIGQKRSFLSSLVITIKKFIPVAITTLVYQVLIILGILLFIFPGIYLGILFFMYLPLIVIDNESMYQSFIKSAKLVFGSWWETFLLMLLPTGLIYFIRELMRSYFANDILMLSLCIILLSLIIPYSYALLLTQFNNLKIKANLAKITDKTVLGEERHQRYRA